jgi:hypothetical protein
LPKISPLPAVDVFDLEGEVMPIAQLSRPRRAKVFGLARGRAHDRNARARIEFYVLAWNARHKQPRQHQGPITAAHQRVLHALLWRFLSYKTGLLFPSYETIAAKARCHRDTVHEAIKALERTGVFEWVNRIDRLTERVRDELLGGWKTVQRLVRRSNVYTFHDPLPATAQSKPPKSENPTGPDSRDILSSINEPSSPPSPLEMALERWQTSREAEKEALR